MGVARDHDVESGSFGFEVDARQIMQHVDGDARDLHDFCFRQFVGPRGFVDIAANRGDWRDGG
jgi:hypothetical protein